MYVLTNIRDTVPHIKNTLQNKLFVVARMVARMWHG